MLGKAASDFFVKVFNKTILYSDGLIRELKRDYGNETITHLLSLLYFNKTLAKIEITRNEHLESKQLSGKRNLPYIDCLNAVQARNHNAILVSQDKHILNQLADIAQVSRPEDIT